MTASIVEVIQHYQRSIDSSQDNEDRLLYCIKKLYNLPIKVEHLQETGVGKTVNSLRKFNGEIGVAAKSLVTKWKAMVAAEEEPMDTTPQSNDNDPHDNHNDDDDDLSPRNSAGFGGGIGNEDDENHNQLSSQEQRKSTGDMEKERHKERHKEQRHKESSSKHSSSSSKHSEDKHKPSTSSSSSSRIKEGHQHKSSGGSSSKEREKEKTEHKSRDKHKDRDQEKNKERGEKHKEEKHKSDKESKHDSTSHKNISGGINNSSSKSKIDERHSSSSKDKSDKDKERSDKHKSSSKDKEKSKEEKSSSSSKDKHERKSSSSKSSSKDISEPSSERKRRNTSDTESNDFKSPEPKVAKVKQSVNSSSKNVESTSPPQEEDEENSFDSSMGANFGDILGMLNAPSKKGKKSLKSSSICGSSTSVKDSPKPSTSNSVTAKSNGFKTSPAIYSPQQVSKISTTTKPDLLAPTAKLAPLDPSIVLELPTISTNYKPMPLNQTVMDCVFNTSSSSSSRPVRTLTDAEALQHGISSKTMRTKIYSGVRTGQILQAPSLFDMCIRVLQKNIDALEYTGGVPFEVLRPVLDKATPQQLFIFEDYNPYLMEDSDILWQTHVSRNYRTQKRIENESWREMYMRCQEEEDRRLSVLKNTIKQSQKVAAAPVRKTQLAFIDSMVKPPRNVMRKQEQYGTKSKLVATPAARVASLQSVTPNAAKTGDQRLKVASAVRDHAQVASSSMRPKKAPLMQKTLAFMRGRLKR